MKTQDGIFAGIDPAKFSFHVSSPLINENLPFCAASFNKLREIFSSKNVSILIEGRAFSNETFILELSSMPVYEVNPQLSHKMRSILTEKSSDKDDAQALYLLGQLSVVPPIKTNPLKSSIKKLHSNRKILLKHEKQLFNKLHSLLIQTWGYVYKEIFPDISSKKALRFFSQFPSINSYLDYFDGQRPYYLDEQLHQKILLCGKFSCGDFISNIHICIKTIIENILTLKTLIKNIESEITRLSYHDKDTQIVKNALDIKSNLFSSLISCYIGSIDKFSNDNHFAGYCGLAPSFKQSGCYRANKKRRRFSRTLKEAFVLVAFSKIGTCPKTKSFYQKKKQEGLSHWKAIISIARYLARKVFKALKNTPQNLT